MKDRKSESVFVSFNASVENNIQGDSFWKKTFVAVSHTAKLETELLTGDDSGFALQWMVTELFFMHGCLLMVYWQILILLTDLNPVDGIE